MKFLAGLATGIAALMIAGAAHASVIVGESVPQFTLVNSYDEIVNLSDFAGERVILEWTNHDCPYVRKHYSTGNMQALQQEAEEAGYIWLSIISSAPGRQGYVSGEEANNLTASRGAFPDAVLMDPDGDVGHAYGALTTPHMYIISEEQLLLYQGAIDDQPTTRRSSVEGANNYVRLAMADIDAGRDVEHSETTAYGCSIKYR